MAQAVHHPFQVLLSTFTFITSFIYNWGDKELVFIALPASLIKQLPESQL